MTARLDPIATVSDAEDIVREAFIGWMGADYSDGHESCPWHLPLAEEEALTSPLPLALECLTPLAPALLLLLDLFGLEFE
jgi:hypothetical protein